MSQIIEKLEKAERCIRPPSSFCTKAHEFLSQALTLFKQQPPAGEFTKKLRNDIGKYKYGYQEKLKISAIIEQSEVACDRLDRTEAINKDLVEALEQSKEIYSKKLCSIRERENKAKDNLHFIESRYWGGIYYQIFELRMEIERMLDKKNLNDFCILMAFMPEEKKAAAITKAKKVGG